MKHASLPSSPTSISPSPFPNSCVGQTSRMWQDLRCLRGMKIKYSVYCTPAGVKVLTQNAVMRLKGRISPPPMSVFLPYLQRAGSLTRDMRLYLLKCALTCSNFYPPPSPRPNAIPILCNDDLFFVHPLRPSRPPPHPHIFSSSRTLRRLLRSRRLRSTQLFHMHRPSIRKSNTSRCRHLQHR